MLASLSSLSESCLVLLADVNVTIFMPIRTVRPSQNLILISSETLQQRYVNISHSQFHVNRTTNMESTDKHLFTPPTHFHCTGFRKTHNDLISFGGHMLY